jgi:hypothetical protein
MTIREAMNSDFVDYNDFRAYLHEEEIGNWDGINDTDTIKDYCCEMIHDGVVVSHIVAALEQDDPSTDDWKIWLGNSMETPEPIWDKVGLVDALEIEEDELEKEYSADDDDETDE